jgi:spore germination protein YaaH
MSLSVWWYVVGWSYGLRYQGQSYTLGCSLIAALLAAAIVILGVIGHWRRSTDFALLGRWLGLVFVMTYAFPWLGEFI